MPDTRTIGELYKLKHITDEQLDAAVRDDLNDPTPGMRLIAEGVALDVAAVVLAHPYARKLLGKNGALDCLLGQRTALATSLNPLRRPQIPRQEWSG
ncbi:hypothetical protein [Methylobacterium nodulans]|uniref:Uncharacterized protein n=1 Tax=Methylobacterium nodulans (strain LMG 21967 / CNCM I-2342 / ORS 2060) TaxID=460265 RepID=B8ITE3_METNO|nr:hypothetical protein [Methylobacterium nodulans]ACL57029.1 conserved hypothetical protein [Methylobacterium nodulans ORS 2060]